jgi:ABC-type sugar transport system substrate-binding protein
MVTANRIASSRKLTAIVFVAALLLILALGPARSASADAGAGASCMGHEASGISPPGSSDEFVGGMPEFRQFIADNFPGTPAGAIIRTIAKQHGVSHEACE